MSAELPHLHPPAVRDAAWRVVEFQIWHERCWLRLKGPEAARLVRRVHEALLALEGGRWTPEADRRLRDAYAEAAEAAGIEPPPWH